MNGFSSLTTSDLILCSNLLQKDARDWEEMTNVPEHQALLKQRAADRRALADRMNAEVRTRDAQQRTPNYGTNTMKASITTNIVVTLVLSPEEAAWLHIVMQNPLHGQRYAEETNEDSDMRKKFFDATTPTT